MGPDRTFRRGPSPSAARFATQSPKRPGRGYAVPKTSSRRWPRQLRWTPSGWPVRIAATIRMFQASALVAQLDRVADFESVGWRFESSRAQVIQRPRQWAGHVFETRGYDLIYQRRCSGQVPAGAGQQPGEVELVDASLGCGGKVCTVPVALLSGQRGKEPPGFISPAVVFEVGQVASDIV